MDHYYLLTPDLDKWNARQVLKLIYRNIYADREEES